MSRVYPLPSLLALACLLAIQPVPPVAAQEKDPPSDSITPIASGITEFPTTLDIDGQKVAVALAYAKQGNTVFVLPAMANGRFFAIG